jgi:hypothetical protein
VVPAQMRPTSAAPNLMTFTSFLFDFIYFHPGTNKA